LACVEPRAFAPQWNADDRRAAIAGPVGTLVGAGVGLIYLLTGGRMRSRQNPASGRQALPPPAGWAGHRPGVWIILGVGYLAAMTLGVGGLAVWALLSGQPATGVAFAVATVYLGHVVGLGVWGLWGPPRPLRSGARASSDDDSGGVSFHYSTWAYYWLTAVLVMTMLGVVGFAAAAAATATAGGLLAAALLALMTVVLLWFLITMLRLAPGRLTLSSTGIDHRSLTHTHFVPWYAIFEISAVWAGFPLLVAKAFPSEGTRLVRYLGRFGAQEFLPFLVVRVRWLATDPVVVYDALSFYHAHPDQRAELATSAALQRISSGRIASEDH
jgi:hypothetical protein